MIDLGELGLDRGAHLLLERALRAGEPLELRGAHPELDIQLSAWSRAEGHRLERHTPGWRLWPGPALGARLVGAERAGQLDRPSAQASPGWGLAARGALVEAGNRPLDFALSDREVIWTEEAPRLYAAAAAAQWDPNRDIDWSAAAPLPPLLSEALVQLLTYLIENETAALIVPARFLGRLHPHFREVMQVLAIQAADEARHIEVFTRRAALLSPELGLSTAGGQASLATLLDEPDFALAGFLLSVLGEGTFLSLLRFIGEQAPDPLTAQIMRLAVQDEARHVAFGIAHLQRHLQSDPSLRPRLIAAVERRHSALAQTAGLNALVFESLVLLAAQSLEPEALGRGWDAVMALQAEMDQGRRVRLGLLGFDQAAAAALSALHTRNFM
jgi:hypothetical protein